MPSLFPHRRFPVAALAVAALAALAAAMLAAAGVAATRADTVKVWFLQGEQMIAVDRPGSTPDDAIRALAAGPTAAELKRGIRTYVPTGTPVRSVSESNGIVVVDLGEKFVQGRDSASLLARLSQVIHTASGTSNTTRVRLLIKGGTPLGMFPGAVTAVPITVKYLETPNVATPKPPAEKATPVVESVAPHRSDSSSSGTCSRRTSTVEGPDHGDRRARVPEVGRARADGQLGPATVKRLQTASRPTPRTRGIAGRRAEVLLDRQVGLAIENNRVVRVLHVSTGGLVDADPSRRLQGVREDREVVVGAVP